MSELSRTTRRIGSRGYWLWLRLFQYLLAFGLVTSLGSNLVAKLASSWSASLPFVLSWVPTIFMWSFLLYMSFVNHGLSYGHVDEGGISYRRYFRKRYLRWNKIPALNWNQGSIQVILSQADAIGQQLLSFPRDLPASALWNTKIKESKPELVSWLEQLFSSLPTAPKLWHIKKQVKISHWGRLRSGDPQLSDILTILWDLGVLAFVFWIVLSEWS